MKCLIALFGLDCWAVTRVNNGEYWFSRPSEHVSPRRD